MKRAAVAVGVEGGAADKMTSHCMRRHLLDLASCREVKAQKIFHHSVERSVTGVSTVQTGGGWGYEPTAVQRGLAKTNSRDKKRTFDERLQPKRESDAG